MSKDNKLTLDEFTLDENTLERLAALNHQIYCEMMTANGYRYGPVRDDTLRTRPLLTDYANLPDENKQSNREVVRSIPEKLHAVGCVITPNREETYSLTSEDIEVMARLEHKRYVDEMLRSGWRFGPQFNNEMKENPTLVPWEALSSSQAQQEFPAYFEKIGPGPLSEEERQKDRNQVKGYITLLKRAGLSIVRAHE